MSTSKFSANEMKARFWELETLREGFMDKCAPLRKKIDELATRVGPLKAQMKALGKQVDAIQHPAEGMTLPEIDVERAMLARALGNKPGPRPTA